MFHHTDIYSHSLPIREVVINCLHQEVLSYVISWSVTLALQSNLPVYCGAYSDMEVLPVLVINDL